MSADAFWHEKDPCWELLGCPEEVSRQCVARREPEKPCWDHEGTQCEKVLGLRTDCEYCKVFKRYAG